MKIAIQPCPFCGHDDVEIDEVAPSVFSIACPECGAIGPDRGTVMESISFWNDRRHKSQSERDMLWCLEQIQAGETMTPEMCLAIDAAIRNATV